MVNNKQKYEKTKTGLINNKNICAENRKLYKDFFIKQEYKLKRINNLRELDNATYKTLYHYCNKFYNVNKWFKNKPLKNITKTDIKRVYDNLEDGKILTQYGEPFKTREDYYNKVFKSTLFRMIGKDIIAKEVIQFQKPNHNEVRFINEEDFRKIERNVIHAKHKLLVWLAWDIGENITSLLQLRKKDFYKQKNETTKEEEYRVNLKKDILKRSRTPRSEITNYNETNQWLDQILPVLTDEELLFNFEYRNAKKFLDLAVKKSGVKCIPNNENVTWKDLRSSMACDLLTKSYTTDEVNARLGHKPSSSEIDKYVNFLAIDRSKPKLKIQKYEIDKLTDEVTDLKRALTQQTNRNEQLQEEMSSFKISVLQMLAEKIKNVKS